MVLKSFEKLKKVLRGNCLLVSIFVGVILGCVIGISSHDAIQSSKNPSPKRLSMYVKFPGELFIRMLKVIVVPLVTSSVIVALTDTASSSAGQLGKRTIAYYVGTTIFSAILGVVLGKLFSPGSGVGKEGASPGQLHRNSADSFLDLFRNFFPDNIVEAMFYSTYTVYDQTPVNYRFVIKSSNTTKNMSASAMAQFIEKNMVVPRSLIGSSEAELILVSHDVTHEFQGVAKGGGTNMIGLLVFSVAFGMVLRMCKEEGEPLVNVCKSLWSATMKLVEIIMWISPVGIASIIAGNIAENEDILSMFTAMGMFVLTIVVGDIILAGIFYPTLYILFVRRNPLQHLKNVMPALITAFGTSSSAVTLPTTIECCESRAKIDKRVTRFVLPIGATCNMDGLAMFLAIVVLFIDQIDPTVNLDIGDTIVTIVVSTMISIGAPAIPGPGLVAVVIVLETIGMPITNIGPVLAVFWFIDRLGTTINVMGDTYAAAFVAKLSQAELEDEDNDV